MGTSTDSWTIIQPRIHCRRKSRKDARPTLVAKAEQLSADATPDEKAYIDALALRFQADPSANLQALSEDYARAMRILSSGYPNDPDASTLFAESLMEFHPYHLWSRKKVFLGSSRQRSLRCLNTHCGAGQIILERIISIYMRSKAPISLNALESALRLASSAAGSRAPRPHGKPCPLSHGRL